MAPVPKVKQNNAIIIFFIVHSSLGMGVRD
jgi:hypothetical protein